MTIYTHTTSSNSLRENSGVRSKFANGLFALIALLLASTLEAQNFDAMGEAIAQGSYGNLKAVIISRHGEIIYEDYFRGSGPNDLLQVQSITKSVGSALIGIAHRQGKIRLDEDMGYFFGGLYPMSQAGYQNKSAITVEQILQQRHGIEWDETHTDYRNPLNPVGRMINSDDWYRFVLNRPMDALPGTKFNYSSGASTLMSRMVRVASGMSTAEFAMQELFDPLEIEQVHWEVYSEGGMGTGLSDWPEPDFDVPLGFSLWLKARDILKFGELYLNGGVYKGKRILDQSWIDASWTKYSNSGNSGFFPLPGWGYGYQWWIAEIPDELDRSWQVFFASGWGSQVIFVVPELDLVLVTAGDNYDHNGPDVDSLLISLLSELNPDLDQRFDGSWYNPAQDGQGFNLDILDDGKTVISYWYTYDNTGSGTQRWFMLEGQIHEGAGDVTIYETSGGVFLQSDPYYLRQWGTGRFSAVDCNHIDFEFESEEIAATIPLTRLTGACYEAP
jgi:CubicO group peptidase (beta-lactamase class C family)